MIHFCNKGWDAACGKSNPDKPYRTRRLASVTCPTCLRKHAERAMQHRRLSRQQVMAVITSGWRWNEGRISPKSEVKDADNFDR